MDETPDLHILAAPEYVPPPPAVERLNRELRDRFGLSPTGLANFRAVDARRETHWFQGRQAMVYPHPTERPTPESTFYVRAPGLGLVAVPADPREYTEELAPYAKLPVGVEVMLRQKGAPFWVMEGWRPAWTSGWVSEEADGPYPSDGIYSPLWQCTDGAGGARTPGDMDLDEIARRVKLQGESELHRDSRWDGEFDPENFSRRVDASRADWEKTNTAEMDEFEEESRRYFRDRFVRDVTVAVNREGRPSADPKEAHVRYYDVGR